LSKNSSEKPQREVTKRQLSHWQRESRLQKIVVTAGICLIAAILIVVSVGYYLGKYKPYHTTVLKVGDTSYSMDYFIDMLTTLGDSQEYAFYYSYFGKAQAVQYLAGSALTQIEQAQIISEAAASLNPAVVVSDDEVKKYIDENKLTSSDVQFDRVRYMLVLDKLQTDYFDKQIGPMEQRALLAMFLESQSQVDEVKAKLDKGEKFGDLAAQYSHEAVTVEKKGDFGWLPKGVLSSVLGNADETKLDDKVFDSGTQPMQVNTVADDNQTKSVGYWVLKVTENKPSTKEVHLLAMLLGSQESANNMIAKLNAGADFVTEAKASSLYQNAATDGGDLGLITKGTMGDAVDAVIFPDDATKTLPVNTLSAAIPDIAQSTSGGIWLFEVTEINPSREVTGDSRTILVQQKTDTWANQVWKDNQSRIQNLLDPDQQAFAISKVMDKLPGE
jgi:parvulin-like peptidyl-prolyl isomerase